MFWKKYKNVIIYCATILLSILFILVGYQIATRDLTLIDSHNSTLYPAKVTKIVTTEKEEFELDDVSIVNRIITFEARITNGKYRGQTVTATQPIDGMVPVHPDEVREGDSILLFPNTADDGSILWEFSDYHRSIPMWILCIAFLVLILLFGRKKGVNTVISLAFTCLAIFCIFIPSILSGQNIYLSSSIVCLFIIFMTLLIVNGADKKSLSAAIGCLGGLAVAGSLTVLMSAVMKLTGALDEEHINLIYMTAEKSIDLKAIIFGAILIGALGATMDVAMSIASSLNELCEKAPGMSFREIFKSGLTIGRDIMGTMANTLILAYIGSSLSTVLLLVAYNSSFTALFNREMIAVEIMQAVVGSLGILFTIPITAFFSSYMHTRGRRRIISSQSAAPVPVPQQRVKKTREEEIDTFPGSIPFTPHRSSDEARPIYRPSHNKKPRD